MRTPVTIILCAMAVCDTIVLASNLVYTSQYNFVAFKRCDPKNWSYSWALFFITHAHLALAAHTSSVWLSVTLAFFRYLTLRSRGNMGGMQVTLRHSYIAIGCVIGSVVLLNVPNFLLYQIKEKDLKDECQVEHISFLDKPAYQPTTSNLAIANDCIIFRLAFWVSGIVFKVIPCALLVIFVILLLRILKEVKANRQRLLKHSRHNTNAVGQSKNERTMSMSATNGDKLQRNGSVRGRGERVDRTTYMLLAIVFVMLITEIPQGVAAILSGIFDQFHELVYMKIGDLLDLLSILGSCSSFIIYCSMSGHFRNEFARVFIPSGLPCDSLRKRQQNLSLRRQSETLYTNTNFTKMSLSRPPEFSPPADKVDNKSGIWKKKALLQGGSFDMTYRNEFNSKRQSLPVENKDSSTATLNDDSGRLLTPISNGNAGSHNNHDHS
ncbi:hypothetical protein WR25_18855 [Diploscapter pachys]|uniref:G-protein coupled receptors family 1 profile domain-containing protein n=1 Tax=Diploscapter pachys TaxID=2018661 RepID=A0A2A2KAK3_9BILA|nr:hypothetical protein WR25_18855 [Diploscapter pachys]